MRGGEDSAPSQTPRAEERDTAATAPTPPWWGKKKRRAVVAGLNARVAHPEIPWRMIIATRNRLIHGNLGIDDGHQWNVAPGLLRLIQSAGMSRGHDPSIRKISRKGQRGAVPVGAALRY